MVASNAVAYAGAPPGNMPIKNAFAFAFSQPFQTVNDFTPQAHTVPRIESERPIFVDNATGVLSRSDTTYMSEIGANTRP
jgi:hypothetical protein